ncbi:apolipoprotein D [Anopheles darlingi]|uniref:Apolipoprotein D n=1 Tax=Anopheles darlingi TaxID=43151 RepID=W5JCE5_ANODA|nr:apolipoprotein D [Anopheles darlingi]
MKQLATTVLLVATLAIGSATAGAVFDRPCPTDIEAKLYFNVDAYLGKWYELQRYESEFELNYDCIQVRYGLNEDGSVSVSNSGYNLFNSSTTNALGRAVLSFPDEEILQGKLNVSFFGAPNDRSNYWVLETDYETYSLVWSCEPLEDERSEESFWLLSRTPTLTTDRDDLFRIQSIIRRYIDRRQIRFTQQLDSRCPEF